MKRNDITAIVLTCNEEENIKRCLEHLEWADRLVVVDSGSTDATLEYASEFGCDIYRNSWPGFSEQRNWSLDNADIATEWVLFIDADEIVTPLMCEEICRTLASARCNAFYVCYKVMLFGRWVKRSSNFPVWHPRIIRFGKARYVQAATGHGESWLVEGDVGYIKEPYIHFSFSKGLAAWFEKHSRNSSMECDAILSGRRPIHESIRKLIGKDRHSRRQAMRALSYYLPCRPLLRFLHQFIVKGGVLDGPAGWTYCGLYLAYEIMISAKVKEKIFLEQAN